MSEKDEKQQNNGVSSKVVVSVIIILLLLGIFALVKFTGKEYSNPYTPDDSIKDANSRITYIAQNNSGSNDDGTSSADSDNEITGGNQSGESSSENNEGNSGNGENSSSATVTPETTNAPVSGDDGSGNGDESGNAGSEITGSTGSTGNGNTGNTGNSGNSGSGNGSTGNGGSSKATPTPTPKPANTGSSGGTTASGTPVSVHGKLSVKGTQLVDKNGNSFQLKGVSTHGLQWFPDYVNKAAFTSLRDEWGCNVVRLALYTHESGYCSGGNKTELKKLVTDGVSYATDLGMYVIIDWHVLNEQDPNKYKSEAITFFDEMSKKYASYNNVIYEICNEPNGGTSWSTVKSYANEIISVIRKNDSDAIIIVGTPTWSQDVDKAAASPITGYSNIMYALHFYAGTHQQWLRDRMVAAINAGLPIFVSEYGITDASGNGACNVSQANSWVETMDKYGVSYVCWNLANKNESSCLIKSSVSKKSGWTYNDLSTEGQWLVDTLGGSIAKYTSGAKKSTTGGNSNTGSGNSGGNTPTPTPTKAPAKTPTPTPTKAANNTPSPTPTKAPASGNSSVVAEINSSANSWPTGDHWTHQFTYNVTNNKTTALNGWTVTITFSAEVSNVQGWNADYTLSGKTLTIKPSQDWAKNIAAGQTFTAGFSIEGPEGLSVTSIKVS